MSDPTTKRCSRCGDVKPLDAFYRHPYGLLGRQSHCIVCRKVLLAERQMAAPGRYAAVQATHYQRLVAWKRAHPDRVRENDARFRAANRERRRAASSAWARANPDTVAERNARYRARKKDAYVAPVSRRAIYERDGGICGICQNPVPFDAFHLDHIIPLARGGTHEPKNVQVAHGRCNNRKYVTGMGHLRLLE